MKFYWNDNISAKPKRQPDYVHNMDPYWFEEMCCIIKVSFPMSTSRRLCKLEIFDPSGYATLDIRLPDGAVQQYTIHQSVVAAYEEWKVKRAEELLLGI